MELRSGRRLHSSSRQHQGEDRISALPDDLLRHVLARLGCPRAAKRTSVLSRRWRDLLLPGHVLRGVAFHKLGPALASVSPGLSLLEIHVAMSAGHPPPEREWHRASRVSAMLRAAARLAPEQFVLALPGEPSRNTYDVELPRFHRATSIMLDSYLFFRFPAGVLDFPALHTMSLSGCMVDLKALLPRRCPRLRSLSIKLTKYWSRGSDLTVHSTSLQELVVENQWLCNVDIVAPSLKQLTLSMTSNIDRDISVVAPMLDKVSWQCLYSRAPGEASFGIWCLHKLRLQSSVERQGHPTSLHIHAYTNKGQGLYNLYVEADTCSQAIQKHIVHAFSLLELHIETAGHVYGAFVFHLIRVNWIHSAMQRLKVVLRKSTEKEECSTNCRCDPMNWKTETTSLSALEEMEIDGFEGEDHEFDFLELVCKSAPILERVIVKLSPEDSSSGDICTKLYDIFSAYSFVKCCVYLSSGEYYVPCA